MAKSSNNGDCGNNCPLRRALHLLEGKYSIHILKELLQGTRRFGDLRKNIPGIAPKTLSDRLKYFVTVGIISRYAHSVIPPKVEYQLTGKGEMLESVIKQLEGLGQTLDQPVDFNQRKSDALAEPA